MYMVTVYMHYSINPSKVVKIKLMFEGEAGPRTQVELLI